MFSSLDRLYNEAFRTRGKSFLGELELRLTKFECAGPLLTMNTTLRQRLHASGSLKSASHFELTGFLGHLYQQTKRRYAAAIAEAERVARAASPDQPLPGQASMSSIAALAPGSRAGLKYFGGACITAGLRLWGGRNWRRKGNTNKKAAQPAMRDKLLACVVVQSTAATPVASPAASPVASPAASPTNSPAASGLCTQT